jgi:hypothetical protein
MSFRPLIAGTLLLAIAQNPAQAAATLTTSYSTWLANVPPFLTTTQDPNYNGNSVFPATTSSISTSAGGTLTTSPGGDAILKAFTDWGPWIAANGVAYHGIVYDTQGQSETISLPSMFTAFGIEIQPDGSGPGGFAEVITVTLSDGQSTTVSQTFTTGQTAFIGYYGGRETSMTISVANASDFAFGDFRVVPEPASMLVFGTGLTVMGFFRRHRV